MLLRFILGWSLGKKKPAVSDMFMISGYKSCISKIDQ